MLGLGKDDKVRIIKISDSTLKTTPAINVPTSFHEGYAKFLLHGGDSVSPEDHDDTTPVKITFRIFPVNDSFIDVTTEIIVKSNRNTPLSELLDGSAVWTNVDHIPDWSSKSDEKKGQHTGQTQSPGDASFGPDFQYFDYGQYMMNMVTIPLVMPVQESNLKYSIKPDGVYGGNTRKLLEALMGNTADASIPEYTGQSLRDVGMNIGHHDNDFVDDTLLPNNTEIHSFRKLLQDYQSVEDRPDIMDQEVQVALELESDFKKIPRLTTADHVYKIMTPELMRGRVLNAAENRTIAAGSDPSAGVFTDEDLGLYEMFRSYDWDGDGVSNLAEVENATQFTNTGSIIFSASVDTFNPLTSTDSALAETLKGAYSRGGWGMNLERNSITDPNILVTPRYTASTRYTGLGEISSIAGETVSGLRLPTFAPGIYDFPGDDNINVDSYTTLRILNYLESVGRSWAQLEPNIYPLDVNPYIAGTSSSFNKGNLRIGFNDLSGPGGGFNASDHTSVLREGRTLPNTNLGHTSHQNGLDADIRYVSKQSGGVDVEQPVNFGSSRYDHAKTRALLRNFAETGTDAVAIIFVSNDVVDIDLFEDIENDLEGLAIVRRLPAHDNHAHIRFSNTELYHPQAVPNSAKSVTFKAIALPLIDENMATEMSTHDVESYVVDGYGNSLLPWRRISICLLNDNGQCSSDDGNIIKLFSGHPSGELPSVTADQGKENYWTGYYTHAKGRNWVNYSNTSNDAGKVKFKVTCKSEGDQVISLKDTMSQIQITEITINCTGDGS